MHILRIRSTKGAIGELRDVGLAYTSTAYYDQLDQLVEIIDNAGNQTGFSYCSCGDLQTIVDPLTNSTTLNRDFNGRVTNIVFTGSGQRNLVRNILGQVTNLNDASGLNINFQYNNQGLLTQATSTNGALLQVVYDAYDRPITNVTAEGVVITNAYDALGRLTFRGFPNTGFEEFDYSNSGLTTYHDPRGNRTQFAYDLAGHLAGITNANGEWFRFGYDAAGDVVAMTNTLGQSTTWAYDIYGHVIAETNANGVLIVTNGYDLNGNQVARWTKTKLLATFAYDPDANLTNASYPTITNSYAYDGLNRLTKVVDTLGTSTLTYANFGAFWGALGSESGPWASDTRTYGYANGVLQSLTLTQPSGNWTETFATDGQLRFQTLTTPDGTYSNSYYAAGRLIQTLSLPGGCYITNRFDANGTLQDTWLKNASGTILNHHGYGYDLAFNRTNATRTDSSHINYLYDNIGQLLKATAYDTAGTTTPRLNEAFGYGYDKADNLIARTNGVLTESLSVDGLNQLGTLTRSASLTAAGQLNMAPQPNSLTINTVGAAVYGDLTFATTNGLSLNNGNNNFTSSLINSLGQTLTQIKSANLPSTDSFYYDYDGNLTNDGFRIFQYDDVDRLIAVTVSNAWRCEYTYDGLSRRRITKQYSWNGSSWGSATNELHYVYDQMLVLQERNGANQPLVKYTRGPDLSGTFQGAGGIGGLLARTDTNGATFYHMDGAGNITTLINPSGLITGKYLYDPFGNLLGMNGALASANSQRFSSKEIDSLSGGYYFNFRFYDPNLQRWLNRDPIGEAGGINLYGFVGNNPTGHVDPFGLWWWDGGLIQIGAPQLLHDIFIGDRPPTVVDPNSYLAQRGVDNNFDGETGGQLVGDIGKAISDSLLQAAMMLPAGGEEGAYVAASKVCKSRVFVSAKDYAKGMAAKTIDFFRKNARNLETGQHGDVYKKAGSALIREANAAEAAGALSEVVEELRKEGNRLLEYGNSISHK